jgi:hypothetical protein
VWGVIFAAAGVLLITNGGSLVTQLDWIVPILLILVALGLFASAVGSRPRPVTYPPAGMPPAPWGGTPEGTGAGAPPAGVEGSGGEPEP